MLTVGELLMTKGPDVVVAPPAATAFEAAKLMAQAGTGSVIVREGGRAIGIFTERDLLRKVVAARKDPQTVTLAEVMSAPVASCRLADRLDDCGHLMSKSHIRHLAVIGDDALVGLISLRDVLTAQASWDRAAV